MSQGVEGSGVARPLKIAHVWASGLDWGAGPGEVCIACGVRKGQLTAPEYCSPRAAGPLVVSDYDPFR